MENFVTESHALWARRDTNKMPLERQLDGILDGYLYYPEFEWPKYNVRPPDNHPLIASWRTSCGNAYVFLLEVYQPTKTDEFSYLVIAVGINEEVKKVNNLINTHKLSLSKIEKKELAGKVANKNLDEEIKKRSIENFSKIIGIFTVIVNAFSLYLRKLPPPENVADVLKGTYSILIIIVHFSAIFLLLLIVFLLIVYTFRYGSMMLKRM